MKRFRCKHCGKIVTEYEKEAHRIGCLYSRNGNFINNFRDKYERK